jgi:hypothetical protein
MTEEVQPLDAQDRAHLAARIESTTALRRRLVVAAGVLAVVAGLAGVLALEARGRNASRGAYVAGATGLLALLSGLAAFAARPQRYRRDLEAGHKRVLTGVVTRKTVHTGRGPDLHTVAIDGRTYPVEPALFYRVAEGQDCDVHLAATSREVLRLEPRAAGAAPGA